MTIEYEPDPIKRREGRRRRVLAAIQSSGVDTWLTDNASNSEPEDPLESLALCIRVVAEGVHYAATGVLFALQRERGGAFLRHPEYFEFLADRIVEDLGRGDAIVNTLRTDKRFVAGLFGNMTAGVATLLHRVRSGIEPITDDYMARFYRSHDLTAELTPEYWSKKFATVSDDTHDDLLAAAEKLAVAAKHSPAVAEIDQAVFADIAKMNPAYVGRLVRDGKLELTLDKALEMRRQQDGRRKRSGGEADTVDGWRCARTACGRFYQGSKVPAVCECGAKQFVKAKDFPTR